MHERRWIAVGCVLGLALAGCGGGTMTTTDPPPSTPVPVSGNWVFEPAAGGTLTTPSVFPPFLAGSVVVNGTQVSADVLTLLIATSGCTIAGSPDVTLTGAVQKGQIGLTSTSWNGIVFTVTGTISSDGQSISSSWTAKGGCLDGQTGSFVGNYVPPVTGTWTGTASNLPAGVTGATTNSPLAGATMSLQLQQSSTSQGYLFPLSGSVTVSGTNCGFTNGTLQSSSSFAVQLPSSVLGNTWTILASMDDGKSTLVAAGGAMPTNSAQWLTVFGISGGACDGAFAQATLARQ